MKKILFIVCAVCATLTLFSCQKDKTPKNIDFTVALTCEGEALAVADIDIDIYDANLTKFSYKSNDKGQANVTLPEGFYTWSASGQKAVTDTLYKYNGASTAPVEVKEGMGTVNFALNKVVATSSIIIKELYCGGFTDGTISKIGLDGYAILYNNSAVEADATDIVFCLVAPSNGEATNKYYTGSTLLYESESYDWIPAYSAIWWFTSPVTIPAYSQILVAFFGAIDHTKTYAASVDLSKADYYWMSNQGVSQFTSNNYQVSENIPQTHYLTCSPINMGTSWVLSSLSPAFYIGKMKSTDAIALINDTEKYDTTLGTTKAQAVVKFPKAKVVDAVEVWNEAKVSSSKYRFSSNISTGYTPLTNKQGHTSYRNVDKAATEALPENEGKLVTTYDKTLDPSGIDAEASMKNGAHIIFMDTNNSTNDFHQRVAASIK